VTPANVPIQVRLLAFVLGLGSGVAVAGAAFALIRAPEAVAKSFQQMSFGLLVMAFVALGALVWCFWLALRLFEGTPRALTLAKFTFLAQIPKVAFPGFAYEFQICGCTIDLSSTKNWHVGIHFGSNVGAVISPQFHDYTIGINVVAFAAAVYLFKITKPGYRLQKASGDFGLL
jgi:hypothetical protein